MSTPLTETQFFAAAIVCLVGSAAIHIMGGRWQPAAPSKTRKVLPSLGRRRAVEKAIVFLALLCVVAGLGSSTIQRGAWPLITPMEVITATAAGAMLWHLLSRHEHKQEWGSPLFYAIVASLLMWAIARGPALQAATVVDSAQQPWWFTSHLAFALACGAFVKAGSLALASVVTERQKNRQPVAPPEGCRDTVASGEKADHHAMLPGLSLLTASLLITALGGQYTRGVAWSWTASESWQLLAWLFYTMIWCAFVLLGWRGRRLWSLTALGLIVTLLMLNAVGG